MSDRKEQLEQAGPIRVEVGSDGSYGIGWKSTTRPSSNVVRPDRTPRSELTMQIELGDSEIDEIQHKRLYVRVSCDGAIGEHKDDQPVTAFQDDEHAIRWVQYMIGYLDRYLPERMRLMALLTVREAIAKSSAANGIAETDWKQLAETHGKIVEDKIKESLGVRSGPARLFERKQQYLNFLAEAAHACRTGGERFTQERVAEFASKKFNTEKPIDVRMIRQWNTDFTVNWKYWDKRVNRRN